MSLPLVSVLMSVYNSEAYLTEAIESILNQSMTDFEFIIINDGSTDKSTEILRKYPSKDHRITLIEQSNIGLTESLNKALYIAKGKYIARQDSDDISHPDRLQMQIDFLEKNSDYFMIGSCGILIDGQGKKIKDIEVLTEYYKINERLTTNNQFIHGSIVARRDAIIEIGGYRNKFIYAQDYDLWLRLSEKYFITNVKMPLYKLRQVPSSISITKFDTQITFAILARIFHRERKEFKIDSYNDLIQQEPEELIEKRFPNFLGPLKSEKFDTCITHLHDSRNLKNHRTSYYWINNSLRYAYNLKCYQKILKLITLILISNIKSNNPFSSIG
jgi:glycosyltransferase involved in cell wall biosynthesis